VDTGATGFITDTILKSLKIMDKTDLDILIFYSPMNWLTQVERQGVPDNTVSVAKSLGRLNKKLSKVFAIICPIFEMSDFNALKSIEFKQILWKYNIPHFETIMEAGIALRHAAQYAQYLEKQS
jgi:hypothetical protein